MTYDERASPPERLPTKTAHKSKLENDERSTNRKRNDENDTNLYTARFVFALVQQAAMSGMFGLVGAQRDSINRSRTMGKNASV